MIRLLGLIVPLGLDTFAVAAALGVAGLPKRDRLKVSVIFTAFESGMPVLGLLVGAVAGELAGRFADWVAIAALLILGVYLLVQREDEAGSADLLARTHGLGMLALGLSISLDELAIGFALGLLRAPLLLAIVLIGFQAFAVTQLGLRLGSRLGDAVREGAQRLAGAALILLGAIMLASVVAGFRF